MDKQLKEMLSETSIEDIPEKYRPVIDIIGIEKFAELGAYSKGDELYFPKIETIIAPARNRRIKKEFNGYNEAELAGRYGLTIKQVRNILRDEPFIGQLNILDFLDQPE